MAASESQVNSRLSSREAVSKDIYGNEVQDWCIEEMNKYLRSSRLIRLNNKRIFILSVTTQTNKLCTDLFVNINELEPFASIGKGENNYAVCILCGEPVIRSGGHRSKMLHVKMQHNEWIGAFYVSPIRKGHRYDASEPNTWVICSNCGTDLKKQPFKYRKCKYHCQKCKSIFKSFRGRTHEVPLKPWEDPESLFCNTKFLKKILGKEPAKGTECKDIHEVEGLKP